MDQRSLSLVRPHKFSTIHVFIAYTASKCDDISCGEVIRALNLEDEPELEDIEAKIAENTRETRQWKTKKETAEATLKCKIIPFCFQSSVSMLLQVWSVTRLRRKTYCRTIKPV